MATFDRAVEELAVHQAGAFSRAQAVAAGASHQAIHRRVRSGAWVRLAPAKTYRVAACPPTWQQRLWAAWLWGGEGGAISHRSAAALLGLERFPPGPVEVSVAGGGNHRCRGAAVHEAQLSQRELRKVSGLVVTGPERTLIDVARLPGIGVDVVDDAMESAFRLGLTTPGRLQAALHERGSAALRRLLAARAPGRARGSTLEGRWLRLARHSGLSEPVPQLEVRLGDQRYFLDYAFPHRLLAVELDGFAKLSTKAAKQALLARDTNLRLAGWTVLHFTWDDVHLRPGWVVESVRLALAA